MKRTVFTTNEFTERAEVDIETLQRWIEKDMVQPEQKGAGGITFFRDDMVERVDKIKSLLAMGYDEEEVIKILRKVGLPNEGRRMGEGSGADTESLLTVGTLAESVGVSPRTLKHWEDKGIIEADARSDGGFRLYKEHYIFLCRLIQDLQLFGYSLDEIKQISDYFRDFIAMRDDIGGFSPEKADERLSGMSKEIEKLFRTTAKFRDGIERWEKLLNRHRRFIADVKRANDKRLKEEKR